MAEQPSERERFEAWANEDFYSGLTDIGETWDESRKAYADFAHHMAFCAFRHFAALSQPSTEQGWISVDERLPGEQGCDSEEVMLFINGHCGLTDSECRKGGAWGWRFGWFDADKKAFRVHGQIEKFVTHWQTLPPPPPIEPREEKL